MDIRKMLLGVSSQSCPHSLKCCLLSRCSWQKPAATTLTEVSGNWHNPISWHHWVRWTAAAFCDYLRVHLYSCADEWENKMVTHHAQPTPKIRGYDQSSNMSKWSTRSEPGLPHPLHAHCLPCKGIHMPSAL